MADVFPPFMMVQTFHSRLFTSACLLCLLLISSSGCAFQTPAVELTEVRLVGLNRLTVDWEGTLEIKNPNIIGASFAGYRYQLEVEGQQLASEESWRPFQIPAAAKTVLTIPARTAWDDLWAVAQKGVLGRELVYLLKGTAFLDSPLGKIPIPFSHQGSFHLSELLTERARRLFQGQ